MPYSKNPHKYPPELLELFRIIEQGEVKEIALECESKSEAYGRRVQIQSFFKAMEAEAGKMRELAARARAKAHVKGASADARVEYETAKSLEDLWDQRARVANAWIVKVPESGRVRVVVEKRQLSAGFGASLKAFLDNPYGQEGGTEVPEKDLANFRLEEGMTLKDIPDGFTPSTPEENVQYLKLYVKERNPYDLSGG